MRQPVSSLCFLLRSEEVHSWRIFVASKQSTKLAVKKIRFGCCTPSVLYFRGRLNSGSVLWTLYCSAWIDTILFTILRLSEGYFGRKTHLYLIKVYQLFIESGRTQGDLRGVCSGSCATSNSEEELISGFSIFTWINKTVLSGEIDHKTKLALIMWIELIVIDHSP